MRTLTLPLPYNRANDRKHWRAEKRLKDAYMLRATAMEPWRPDEPYETLYVHATLYTHQRMDEDNLAARLKFTLDWLELREIVGNDRNVRLKCSQVIDRKNQRVELVLLAHPLDANPPTP